MSRKALNVHEIRLQNDLLIEIVLIQEGQSFYVVVYESIPGSRPNLRHTAQKYSQDCSDLEHAKKCFNQVIENWEKDGRN